MVTLQGRVALVTGCGSSNGVGYATALRLANDGADVAIHGRPNAEDDTRELGRLIAGFGRRALRVTGDLSKENDIVSLIDVAFEHFGRIDVLVNNAAVTGPLKPSAELKKNDWEEALAVNLRGPFFCIRECARIMTAQRQGSIVNVVSGLEPGTVAEGLVYATTKAALLALTAQFARELQPAGVRVNAVAPGLIESPIGRALREKASRRAEGTARKEAAALAGSPEDVASAVAFLASDDAAHVSGQTVNLRP
jgi:glucose 1-dehydrogenase